MHNSFSVSHQRIFAPEECNSVNTTVWVQMGIQKIMKKNVFPLNEFYLPGIFSE